jgi:hypothetical protein
MAPFSATSQMHQHVKLKYKAGVEYIKLKLEPAYPSDSLRFALFLLFLLLTKDTCRVPTDGAKKIKHFQGPCLTFKMII